MSANMGKDFQVVAVLATWGIAKDIYAEAKQLATAALDAKDRKALKSHFEDTNAALREGNAARKRFMPFLNDIENEGFESAVEAFMQAVPRNVAKLLENSTALAGVLSETASKETHQVRAKKILRDIGFLHPKGPGFFSS